MELKEQVCSLESAKKLKQLGVKQESIFYYCPWSDKGIKYWEELGITFIKEKIDDKENTYSAFTIPEIWKLFIEQSLFTPFIPRWNGVYWEIPINKDATGSINFFRSYQMTEAYAIALIYMMENN